MPEFAHHLRQSTTAQAPAKDKAMKPTGDKATSRQKDK